MACPDDSTFTDYLERRLAPAARQTVEAHLDGCPDCRQAMAALVGGHRPPTLAGGSPGGDALGHVTLVPTGSRVGRYVIRGPLGQGGMGAVYEAYDPELGRLIALKVLHPRIADSDAARERLAGEARTLARLSHPHVVAVHDVGEHDGQIFIAMAYVPGTTLAAWLREASRSTDEIIAALVAAGRGLAAAHAVGIVHRDFKPDNVLMSGDGHIVVGDFGLARMIDAATGGASDDSSARYGDAPIASGTMTGVLVGTPVYMAPEQHRGEGATAASDQFAFAITLHEALYGVRPFAGDTREALLAAIARGPTPPARSPRKVPAWLDAVIRRGLAPRAQDRFPDLPSLLAVLTRDRRRTLRRVGLAVAAAALVTTGVLVARGTATDERARLAAACAAGADRALDAWRGAPRDAVERAVLATGRSYAPSTWRAVDQALVARTTSLAALRRDTCAATHLRGEATPASLERKLACFDRQVATVSAFATEAARADAAMLAALPDAAAALPDGAACAQLSASAPALTPPVDPPLRARYDALVAEIATLNARIRLIDRETLEPALLAAAAEARAIDQPLLELDAMVNLGTIQNQRGDDKAAYATLRDALVLAERTGSDLHRLLIFTELASTGGIGDDDKNDDWLRQARALFERTGGDPSNAALLESVEARTVQLSGDYVRAAELARRARQAYERIPGAELETAESFSEEASALTLAGKPDEALAPAVEGTTRTVAIVGPDHPLTARALGIQAGVLGDLGRYDEALPLLERALALSEAAHGRTWDGLDTILISLIDVTLNLGQVERALGYARRQLEVTEAAFGPDHPEVAGALSNVAIAMGYAGDERGAVPLFERALALLDEAVGPDHPQIATVLCNLGDSRRSLHDLAGALAAFERARGIIERTLGKDSIELFSPDAGIGLVRLEQRRFRAAVDALERALGFYERVGAEDPSGASVRFALARALWGLGEDRPRARALAERALAGLVGDFAEDRAEIETWLRTHVVR